MVLLQVGLPWGPPQALPQRAEGSERLIPVPLDSVAHERLLGGSSGVHGVITTRILEQFAILLSIRPHFVRTFHYALSVLGGPASLSYASSFAMTR